MKYILKNVFIVISFVFAFFMAININIEAKSSSNGVFEVTVGNDQVPLYYTLVENKVVFNSSNEEVGNLESNVISMNDGSTYIVSGTEILKDNDNSLIGALNDDTITMKDGSVYTLGELSVKERIQFNVYLKGLSDTSNSYSWEHQLCYKIVGKEEICEVDITGSDSTNSILSNGDYSYYFYDGHMPYYSDSLEFEYITFKNKFTCLDCDNNEEYVIDDISFTNQEINYKYSFEIDMELIESDGRSYVENYYSRVDNMVYIRGIFMNNSSSNLILDGSPKYKLIKEVCVGDSICVSEEESSNGSVLQITPYYGSWYTYYKGENLIYENSIPNYEFVKLKATLQCIENCSSRRVNETTVLSEGIFYFDYTAPIVDTENTIINTYNDNEYVNSSQIKITLSDSQSGLDESQFIYRLGWNNNGTCSFTSEVFYYENGVAFNLGKGLKDGAICMYFIAADKLGNQFTSDYYYFYFDNKGPTMSFENEYDSSKYYNNIKVSPTFSDSYSGLKEVYYLWSKAEISEENYLLVKNNGKLFENEVSSSELSEDGSYHLYFLAYDNLDNYQLYDLDIFNIDTIGLNASDVIVEKSGFMDDYSNTGTIKLSISEMSDNEEFKCGFFIGNNVNIDELNYSCNNNSLIDIPTGLEGDYNLFVYVHDKASNYSLLKVGDNFKIDTRAPLISMDVLYNDDSYHLVNEITLNIFDLSGVNGSSLKYGWFLASKNNVLSSDLINSFENGVSFGYPVSFYGEYKLYAVAIDNLGNETFKSLDKIFKIDTDVIRISLIGEESITILKGETYEELGAKAYKGEIINGGRVSEVKVEGSVDSSKAGTYYITYTSGEGDLAVSVTRKVVVKNDLTYVAISGCLFIGGVLIISLRLFIKRKKEANV